MFVRRRAAGSVRFLSAVLALSLMAAACGSDDGGEDDAGTAAPEPETTEAELDEADEPVYGGTVVMGLEAETNSWLPSEGVFPPPGENVALAIYDPLMKRTADGDVQPYLAESLEANDDLTVWTLTLRPGVQFHDGTPLNAQAVKDVFDGWLKAPGSNLLGTLEDVERVEVVDELTAEYHLSRGNAAFPDLLTADAGWVFSPTAARQHGENAGANPVGTGPFVFRSWARDNELVVTRNENYWREGLPYLDEIRFRPIPDEDTRLASLLSGDVDAMHSLRGSIVRQAIEADGIEAHTYLGNNGGSSIFNTLRPPLDDRRVRVALAHAVNQEDVIDVLGGAGLTPERTQYFSPDSPWYSEEVAEAYPEFDPERATELLDEYVNDPDRSDGKPAGSPVAVEYNCPPDPSLIELSQLVQAFWESVGVEVTLNQVEQAAHIQNAYTDEYMINCWRSGAEGDPYTTLSVSFGDPEGNPRNTTNFHDPLIDEQLEVLRTSTDVDTRFEAVETIGVHLNEEMPVIWAGGTITVLAAQPHLDNIEGWTFPDGTEGDGAPESQVMWVEVWRQDG